MSSYWRQKFRKLALLLGEKALAKRVTHCILPCLALNSQERKFHLFHPGVIFVCSIPGAFSLIILKVKTPSLLLFLLLLIISCLLKYHTRNLASKEEITFPLQTPNIFPNSMLSSDSTKIPTSLLPVGGHSSSECVSCPCKH